MTWLHALAFTFAISLTKVILKFLFGEFYYSSIGYSLVITISFGWVLLIGTKAFKEDRPLFFKKVHLHSGPVFKAIGLTFVLCLLCLNIGEIEEMLRPKFDDHVRFGWSSIMKRNFLSILFVAPIIEELFFRGFLLPGLLKTHTKLHSIAVTCIIFLLFHLTMEDVTSLQALSGPLSALVLSLLLSWVMIGFNNIWLCILLHFLWNLFCYLIPALISLSRLPLDKSPVFWVFSVVITTSCLILAMSFVRKLQVPQ